MRHQQSEQSEWPGEYAKHQRNADQDLGQVNQWAEYGDIGDHDPVDQRGLQRDRGVLDGLLHPVEQAVVVWWYLPQRLLPPHGSHDQSQQPDANVPKRALLRPAPPDRSGNHDTEDQQDPVYRRGPDRIGQERQQVRGWVGFRFDILPSRR